MSNNGSAVFYTGNWYAAQSPDSGLNWNYIDPVAAFPTADGGFCCDQITIYDPVNNITIWEILYAPDKAAATAGNNRVRLAVANGQAGVNTGVWHTFDITTSAVMAPVGSWLDYPQLGLGQNNLFLTLNGFQGPPTDRGCYLTSSTCVQVNSYGVRIPLTQLAATGTLSIATFTSACAAFCLDTVTPVQQVGTTMYFGAHGGGAVPDTTILRVLEWRDTNAAPVQHDVADAAFTYMQGAGDGACFGSVFNFCARDDSRVKAGWLTSGEVGFAWDARQDSAFPYPYIRVARVALPGYSLLQDSTIKFQTEAAVYPNIALNARGGLGLTFVDAGGTAPSPRADIAISDDLNVTPGWEMRQLASGTGPNQGNWWGDYLTVRPASGTGNSWVATGYTVQGSGIQPIFAWFGRQRDDPFIAQGLMCAASLTSAMGAQTPTQVIANFTAPSGSLSDYVATIDWGDSSRASTVSATGSTAPMGATVSATHAFASAGSLTVTVTVADRSGGTAVCTLPATITGSVYTTASTNQYQLRDSDGSTWRAIDATHLVLKITPSANSTAIVSANADLWTQNAGINQDIGIAVSGGTGVGTTYPTVAGQPEAWKESGGFAGTFSPNAAFLQTAIPLNAASTYTITLVWKANKLATGATIMAGAGPLSPPLPAVYSPVRLTAHVIPDPRPNPNPNFVQATIRSQSFLQNSNGSAWQDMDAGLNQSFTAPSDGTLVIGGNADLWTANAGYNQDLGITVSGGGVYPTVAGQPEAWKESGGYGGTLSPNAAFVQTVIPVKNGQAYQAKLQWKTNRPSGATIYAGAGNAGAYSPTTLTMQFFPSTNVSNAAITSQAANVSSDGSTFLPMDAGGALSSAIPLSTTLNCVAIVGGNADLWTANAGYNQDIAIWVDGNLLGWKESGGFAGTFSPNAAFVQSVIPVPMNTAPQLILQWKTNIDARASGARIYAGAGPIGGRYSPTRLTAEIICS